MTFQHHHKSPTALRQRFGSQLKAAETVFAKMQAGAALQFQHQPDGAVWQINGRRVLAEVARLVILRNDVVGDNDTLFGDVHSQTYRAQASSNPKFVAETSERRALFRQLQRQTPMHKSDIFPSKYLKAEDLAGKPMAVTIKAAPVETLKSPEGKTQSKAVLYFTELKKCLPLNLTNFNSVADITRYDDTDGWVGAKLELYPTKTQMAGKTVDCIRIRAPGHLATNNKKPKPTPSTELNDEISF